MKKFLKYIVMCAFPMLLFAACSGEEPIGPSLSLTTSELSVGEGGGTLQLKFSSTMDWTAKTNQPWCELSAKSGVAGDCTLQVVVSPNVSFKERETVVTLKTGAGNETVSEHVVVRQSPHGAVTLVIKHKQTKFTVPTFEADGSLYVSGTIRWGDGKSDSFNSSASHDYADNQEHSVSIELMNVNSVSWSDLVGITEIDLSAF